MDVCELYQKTHSEFLSWSRDDRDKAIWKRRWERRRCPSCGTHPDEWDPEQGGHDHAYLPDVHVCWGCNARAGYEKQLEKWREKFPGAHTVLEPNPAARR